MNKIRRFFLATLLAVSSLSACAPSQSLPSSSYDKVKFAFNGVEKSLRSPKVNRKGLILNNKKQKLGGSNPDKGLQTIFSLYTQNDKNDNFVDDVEYNQPPMVQFQYIKKVLEKVGSGYEFNNKYYDTITGEVLLDINTGYKSKNQEDKFNYTFGLAMDINIDDNNLITADVSFDIKLQRNSEEYNTKWYVCIELNYDMTNTSPNYTMTMVTENDERELPFYNHYTYEYDYVEVKDSAINEWRKFCMDNNQRLVKDAAHPNFESYAGEDSVYKVDACSWYKDGVYYKNKRPRELNGNEAKQVGEALFSDLGLNANEINADAFFAKTGKQNNVLKTCYEEFKKIAKEDIIYSLVTREEQDNPQDKRQISSIRAMDSTGQQGVDGYRINGNTTFGEIFSENGFNDAFGEHVTIALFYADQNGGTMDKITSLRNLEYLFKQAKRNDIVQVNFEDKLVDAYSRLVREFNYDDEEAIRDCEIVFKDYGNNVEGKMMFVYEGDVPSSYVKPTFPKVLADMGIPEYEGSKITFEFKDGEYQKELVVNNTNYEEGEAYLSKMWQAGFREYAGNVDLRDNERAYYKETQDGKYLMLNFIHGKNITSNVITVWSMDKPQEQPPAQPYHIYLMGDFSKWDPHKAVELAANYEDYRWTFTIENLHFAQNETFAFVTDPNEPGREYFGYERLVDDPRGYLDIDYDKGPFAFKALKEFTASFTIDETGSLHIQFEDGVQYLTIVGDFSDWKVNESSIELELQSDGSFKKLFTVEANVQFKIMQNHSWDVNYGYSNIKDFQSADMRHRFSQGEQDNIVTLIPMRITLTATVEDGNQVMFRLQQVTNL